MQTTLAPFIRAATFVLTAWLLMASSPSAVAAPLATNLTCADAFVLPGSGPFPYWTPVMNVINATNYTGPVPECAINPNHGVWFSFTPGTTALYTISSGADTATGIEDTVMAIYTSPAGCDALMTNSFACTDDDGTRQAAISTNFTMGTTYWIVVWVANGVTLTNQPLDLQLRLTRPATPNNDNCNGATTIPPAGPFPYLTPTNDTTLATEAGDPPDTGCATGYRSLWYKFTPSAPGLYVFTTGADTATTVDDTSMALYRSSTVDCGGTLTLINCNDNGSGRASLSSNLVAGTQYFLVVWENSTNGYESPTLGETSIQMRVVRAIAPSVTTLPATSLVSTSATLRAQVNPNGAQSRFWFEWGTSTNYTFTNTARLLTAGTIAVTTNVTLINFLPGTNYHYRVVATNSLGKSYGLDQTFQWSGSQPLIAPPTLLSNNKIQVQFTGSTSQIYAVFGSADLLNWTNLGNATELGGGSFTFSQSASEPYRFYRVRLP